MRTGCPDNHAFGSPRPPPLQRRVRSSLGPRDRDPRMTARGVRARSACRGVNEKREEYDVTDASTDTADHDADAPPTTEGVRRNARNPRTCIVTRVADPPEGLVRFVAGPDDTVVPDVALKLPGRGAWVTARANLVERAARRHVFARAFRRQVTAPDDLAMRVASAMRARLVRQLPMLRKAGDLVVGAGKVDALVRDGGAVLVLHAAEAAPDGVRKIDAARRFALAVIGVDTPADPMFTTDELGVAFGDANVIHAGVRDTPGGHAFRDRLAFLHAYLGHPPPGGTTGETPGPAGDASGPAGDVSGSAGDVSGPAGKVTGEAGD